MKKINVYFCEERGSVVAKNFNHFVKILIRDVFNKEIKNYIIDSLNDGSFYYEVDRVAKLGKYKKSIYLKTSES